MGNVTSKRGLSHTDELAFLKFVADNCPCAVFLVGSDASFHYVNKAAVDSLGYAREELLTMGVPDIDPWYTVDEWGPHFREVREQGTQRLETRHKRKDGALLAVEVFTHHVKIGGDEYLCAFASNITSSMENANNLSDMATKFETLFDSYPSPVLVMNEDGVLLGVNPKALSTLGYKLSDMIGRKITEFMDEPSRAHFMEMFDTVLTENDVHCDITYICADGKKIKVKCSPRVTVDEHEEIKSVLLFFEEI